MLNQIYKELSVKYGLTVREITTICNTMFKYAHHNMFNKDVNATYLPFFGSFHMKNFFKKREAESQNENFKDTSIDVNTTGNKV